MLESATAYLDGLEWLESFAVLLVRVAVGAMFALSGWHKLVVPERRRLLKQTLKHDNIPCVQLNAPMIAATELIAGVLLLLGFLATLAATGLAVVTLGAISFDAWRKVGVKQPITWIENFLYLPEVLYLVILIWMIAAGPGAFSVDHLWTGFQG